MKRSACPDVQFRDSLNTTKYETAIASLEKFIDDPLRFPPDPGAVPSRHLRHPDTLTRTSSGVYT
jgi:hypothetical protein